VTWLCESPSSTEIGRTASTRRGWLAHKHSDDKTNKASTHAADLNVFRVVTEFLVSAFIPLLPLEQLR
jgi:hypothetical protein